MSDMWQDLLAKILLYQAGGTPCRLVVQHVHTLALDNTEGLRFNNPDPSGMATAAHASQLLCGRSKLGKAKRNEQQAEYMASNAYLHILKHWRLSRLLESRPVYFFSYYIIVLFGHGAVNVCTFA